MSPEKNQENERCKCSRHDIFEELRTYVYYKIPDLSTKVGRLWATVTTATLGAGLIVTVLLSVTLTSRAEMRVEQSEHKVTIDGQLKELKELVDIISTNSASTLAAVNLFVAKSAFLQEESEKRRIANEKLIKQNCHDIEEIKRLLSEYKDET